MNLKNVDSNDPKLEKYTKKYRLERQRLEQEAAEKMARKAAEKKKAQRAKALDFLFDILKAALGGLIVLLVEHWAAVTSFLAGLFRTPHT